MASVVLERDETIEVVTARARRKQSARKPVPAPRVPSAEAERAAEAFSELRRYYEEAAAMREALGWSAPTLRAWGSEGRPARPRASSAARVMQLRDLCREAGKWVADPWRVGEWTLEPQSQLQDTTPAKVVLSMGEEGVNLLVKNMARIAPKERAAGGPVDIPVDKLRETLTSLDAPSVASAASGDQADVDLSDFDD